MEIVSTLSSLSTPIQNILSFISQNSSNIGKFKFFFQKKKINFMVIPKYCGGDTIINDIRKDNIELMERFIMVRFDDLLSLFLNELKEDYNKCKDNSNIEPFKTIYYNCCNSVIRKFLNLTNTKNKKIIFLVDNLNIPNILNFTERIIILLPSLELYNKDYLPNIKNEKEKNDSRNEREELMTEPHILYNSISDIVIMLKKRFKIKE